MARPGLLVCVFVHKPFLDDALVKLRRCVMALAQAPKPLYKNFFEALSGGVFGWSNRLKERIAVSEKTTVDIDGVWEIAPAFVAQCLGIAERSSLRSPDPHVCIRWSGPRSGIWEIRTAFVSIPCLHAACAVRLFRLMSPPSRGKVFMASDNTQQGAQNKRVNCAEKVADWRRMKAWIASRRRLRSGSTTWSWMASNPGGTRSGVFVDHYPVLAIRKLAVEATDNGLLAPELAAGIARVKSAKSIGVRTGNWMSLKQAQAAPERAGHHDHQGAA